MLVWMLKKIIKHGHLTLILPDGTSHEFGPFPGPSAQVRIIGKGVDRWIAMNPELRIGEAYVDGKLLIEKGSLKDFLEILLASYNGVPGALRLLKIEPVKNIIRKVQTNNVIGKAERNVKHHYDLSGQLYDLFLDRNRQYSCAYFKNDKDTLDDAQINKLNHLSAKLLLKPGMEVLDIGCGWGGLAMHLARNFRVKVTGVTLSDEQHSYANDWVKRERLSHLVTIKKLDYRLETGTFDRIVSVGMFEHVGVSHFREYFEGVKRLLKDDGVALIHTIGRMDRPVHINDWIRQYIFPGGYLPSFSQLMPIFEELGLWLTDLENLRLHYAKTLHHWHKRFETHRAEARALYDERFCRMWEFYLLSCELGFRYQGLLVFQMQLTKQIDVVPLTRDYIYNDVATTVAAQPEMVTAAE